MAVQRGSTSQVTVIKEATAGTTPTTPTMIEIPIVSLTPKSSNTQINSDQIRSHPFRDKLLYGRLVHDIGLEVELQGAVHDILLETFFGGTITTKALPVADALKSLTLEEKVNTGVFNQWTYFYLNSLSIAVGASDTAPIKLNFSGAARVGTLDASATIASTVTPAANVDPYIFANANATWAANSQPMSSASLNFDRAVDPLMLLGSRLPREFVPGLFTVTGTSTLPYDASGFASGATVSGLLTAYSDVAQVYTLGNEGSTAFRKFTFPKTKFISLGRTLSDRGMRMQEVNWEAYYDGGASNTVCTMTTE